MLSIRRLLHGAVFSSAFLVLASGASAATVSLGPDPSGFPALRVTAAAGETNTITTSATQSGGTPRYTITVSDESAPVTAGQGCAQTDPDTATCQTDTGVAGIVALGDGNDRATIDWGNVLFRTDVTGADGNDVVIVIGPGNLNTRIDGGPGDDQLRSGGELRGGPGNDELEGDRDGDRLFGGEGNDQLSGREGNDELFGGEGPGGVAVRSGVDSFDGGTGDDTLNDEDRASATVQDINSDNLIGGTDEDTVLSYQNRVAGVLVDLSEARRDGQSGEGDDVSGVEMLYGGDGDDRLYGDGDANLIFGGPGDDDIKGRGGDDRLEARQGDNVAGDLGDDIIDAYRDSTGYAQCGKGRDVVEFLAQDPDNPSRGKRKGVRISKTCELIDDDRDLLFKPTPSKIRPSGRLTFRMPRFQQGATFTFTRAKAPYRRFARVKVTSKRFSMQMPPDLVKKSRRGGAIIRVVTSKGAVVYRFRIGG
jgi:Ca2+-binding RTX toxin-like protein